MRTGTDRRTFLQGLLAGAALLPSSLTAASRTADRSPGSRAVGIGSRPSPPPVPDPRAPRDEAFWQEFRAQFAFREDRVPMNAANLCPSPRAVAEEVARLTHEIDVDCSFQNRDRFGGMLEASRSALARHFGVDTDEIALVRNTSEANNIVNAGLDLSPGDEVVLWDQNHPTNNVAWDVRAARYGIRVRRVSVPERPGSPDELADAFISAFTPRTRVVAFSHISNVSGIRLPVRAITDAAHARAIHVHVDGAQSAGAGVVNLRELGCDSYATSSHKWLMGPKEAGVLYVRRDRIPDIWPAVVAPGWGNDADPDVVGARKFESLGQRDDACLAAMATTAEMHARLGPEAVEARVTELATALKDGARELGLPLVTPREPALSGGVVIVRTTGAGAPLFERLYREFGIAGAPTGGLRLSPHVYNTLDHVERAVAALEAMRADILAG